MITRVVTIEGVADPSQAIRRLGKDFGDGLVLKETALGVEMTGGRGRPIMVPWTNIAFVELLPEAVEAFLTDPVTKDLPLPVKAAPPPQFEKRGPGRPKK